MSKLTSIISLVAALAGVIAGVSGYRRAGQLEAELRKQKPAEGAKKDDDGSAVSGLEERVRTLERQVHRLSLARNLVGAAPAAAAAPSEPAPEGAAAVPTPAPRPGIVADGGLLEPARMERRLTKVKEIIAERWKKWSDENGLTEQQKNDLTAILTDAAAKREELRLKTRAGAVDRETARVESRKITREVNKKAREVLNEEQFKKFDEIKGASAGTSWRDARRRQRAARTAEK